MKKVLITTALAGFIRSFLKNDIEILNNSLCKIEARFDLENKNPYSFSKKITQDQYKEMVWSKMVSGSGDVYAFLHNFFMDSIVVDKNISVNNLYKCGYPVLEEVKGLSKDIVKNIIEHNNDNKDETTTPDDAIIVPRSLWAGKQDTVIFKDMHEKGFSKAVIAHVLYEWHGLKNKKQLGKLLSGAEREESAYRRLADKYLREAGKLTITTA